VRSVSGRNRAREIERAHATQVTVVDSAEGDRGGPVVGRPINPGSRHARAVTLRAPR